MTAPRTCRACGTPLHGHVMWCLNCFEPVRQLAPRETAREGVTLLPSGNTRDRSRWRAGATTFGPFGRIVATIVVLLFAPWSFGVLAVFVSWPAYLLVAALALRSIWRRDLVQIPLGPAEGPPTPEPARSPIPRSTIVAWSVLIAVGAAVGTAFATSGNVGRALILMAGCIAAIVLLVRSWIRW